MALVSFGSKGIREELRSSQHVDLRESKKYPLTTPHSTYHCNIYILHIIKVIPTLISERAQIRRYTLI